MSDDKAYTIMFPSKEIFEDYKALIEHNGKNVQVVRYPVVLMEHPNVDEWFIAPIYEGIEND